MIRYVVTHFPATGRANLSRVGDWGNVPHSSGGAACAAARLDAGTSAHHITHETSRRSPPEE